MRGLVCDAVSPDDTDVPVSPEDMPLVPELVPPQEIVREGRRDKTLWEACMRKASAANILDEVLAFARSYNEERMRPPLPDSVVVEKAHSAWQYEISGRNAYGGRCVLIPDQLEGAPPDAHYLYYHLKREHYWRKQFMVPRAYGERLGMGRHRLSNAVNALIDVGVIGRLTRGGRFEGDAPIYTWLWKRPR
jgi:hypothetical protein